MRALISKVLTGSMIAGAALMVSACGPKAETADNNMMVTDMNSTDSMDTMSDNMTAVDGAMGNDTGMMSNDTMMSNDSSMMSNSTMSNDTMTNTAM